jgi:hypothetical protein
MDDLRWAVCDTLILESSGLLKSPVMSIPYDLFDGQWPTVRIHVIFPLPRSFGLRLLSFSGKTAEPALPDQISCTAPLFIQPARPRMRVASFPSRRAPWL